MILLNKEPVNITLFSDNTSQVWKIKDPGEICNIEWKFTHEGEFMQLAQLVQLLRNTGGNRFISLHMDYLPYGRQDKLVSNETTFALHTFAGLLNSLKLDKVTALDSHSDMPIFFIDNFKNLFPWSEIAEAVKTADPDVLCFPDKGATERYSKNVAFLNRIHVFGEKQRDQLTGNITNYTLNDMNGTVYDRDVMIIDDVTDGGMTFILLAKELFNSGAKSVSLYTTHGIYSKGLKPLKEAGISRIFSKLGEMSEFQGNIVYEPFK